MPGIRIRSPAHTYGTPTPTHPQPLPPHAKHAPAGGAVRDEVALCGLHTTPYSTQQQLSSSRVTSTACIGAVACKLRMLGPAALSRQTTPDAPQPCSTFNAAGTVLPPSHASRQALPSCVGPRHQWHHWFPLPIVTAEWPPPHHPPRSAGRRGGSSCWTGYQWPWSLWAERGRPQGKSVCRRQSPMPKPCARQHPRRNAGSTQTPARHTGSGRPHYRARQAAPTSPCVCPPLPPTSDLAHPGRAAVGRAARGLVGVLLRRRHVGAGAVGRGRRGAALLLRRGRDVVVAEGDLRGVAGMESSVRRRRGGMGGVEAGGGRAGGFMRR